jgi:hypothetical protein
MSIQKILEGVEGNVIHDYRGTEYVPVQPEQAAELSLRGCRVYGISMDTVRPRAVPCTDDTLRHIAERPGLMGKDTVLAVTKEMWDLAHPEMLRVPVRGGALCAERLDMDGGGPGIAVAYHTENNSILDICAAKTKEDSGCLLSFLWEDPYRDGYTRMKAIPYRDILEACGVEEESMEEAEKEEMK